MSWTRASSCRSQQPIRSCVSPSVISSGRSGPERILTEAKRIVAELHPDFGEAQIERRFADMNASFVNTLIIGQADNN